MTNEKALDKFVELKVQAEAKARAILEHIENHCDTNPDDINWDNVGDVAYLLELLTQIEEFAGI